VKTFNIEINNRKTHEIIVFTKSSKSIQEAIDSVLEKLNFKNLNLAIWFDEESVYGEIIALNENFEEESYIKIKEEKKSDTL